MPESSVWEKAQTLELKVSESILPGFDLGFDKRISKEVERELCDKDFVRCHTSYIVNLFYVKGIKKLNIELITGEVIPISQPKRKEFMERLTDYWGDFL